MKQLKLFFIAVIFSTFTFSLFALPSNLYIIGGPFNANKPNWLFRDIVQLEKDNSNSTIFYYRGYIGYNTFGDERGNFKLLTSNNSWNGYHPVGETNQLIGASQVGITLSMREGGSDTKWEIPADRSGDGYYVIKVNTQDNTFLIESFTAAACPEYPVGLFCVGGPYVINVANWSPDESTKMERDNTNPYVFHYRGFLEHNQWGASEPGNFKILINARDWSEAFHPGETSDNVLLSSAINTAQPIRFQGADNKWQISTDGSNDGYWEYSVNTYDKTIKVDNFIQELDYLEHIYITGNAVPCGWTATTPEVMNKISKGIYSWTGVVNAGEFKFLKFLGKWEGCYVSPLASKEVESSVENNFIYEQNYNKIGEPKDQKFIIPEALANKTVNITINLNTMKMTVSNTLTENAKLKQSIIKILGSKGKLMLYSTTEDTYTAHVFAIDGKKIIENKFVTHSEIRLPEGCYFVTVNNKSGKVAKSTVVIY